MDKSPASAKRRWLPPRLIQLSEVRHLYPARIAVPPARFVVTCFATPSPRDVFRAHAVCIWLSEQTVVTVTDNGPARNLRSLLALPVGATPGNLLNRVLEAAAGSYGAVTDGVNAAFCNENAQMEPFRWHHKERRLAAFMRLMEGQLTLLAECSGNGLRHTSEQLRGLLEMTRSAADKIRTENRCPVCSGSRSGPFEGDSLRRRRQATRRGR